MRSKNVLIALSILLFSTTVVVPIAYAVGVFQKDELPFGKSYEDWVQNWWRWTAAIPGDPVTTFAGVKEDGCLINEEGTVAMLMDPAIGGSHHQKCDISSNQGILISGWSAVCVVLPSRDMKTSHLRTYLNVLRDMISERLLSMSGLTTNQSHR